MHITRFEKNVAITFLVLGLACMGIGAYFGTAMLRSPTGASVSLSVLWVSLGLVSLATAAATWLRGLDDGPRPTRQEWEAQQSAQRSVEARKASIEQEVRNAVQASKG